MRNKFNSRKYFDTFKEHSTGLSCKSQRGRRFKDKARLRTKRARS